MKIGYFTDIHIRGSRPEHRTDDYTDSLFDKIEESFKIFKEQGVQFILCGGDIFNGAFIGLNILDRFLDIVSKYKINIYTIVGNHDMFKCNWEHSSATVMAHILRQNKYIHNHDTFKALDDDCKSNPTYIKFHNYYVGIEDHIREGLFVNEKLDKTECNIVVSHAMITEKPLIYTVLHVPYKELKSNYDFVLMSHNHFPLGIKDLEWGKLVSPGAIARQTVADKDRMRIPQVAILDTITKDAKTIPLKTAKHWDDVFDMDKVKEVKEFNNQIDLFISSLKDTKIQALNLKDMVIQLAKENNIQKDIIDCCIERVGGFEDGVHK